jgi:sulfoxide reductase heme-binding subunit YedZ
MSSDALWYFARGSGVVSLIMLTLVVALGVGARSGQPAFGLPRFAVNLIHRNAALLSVVFIAGHVITLLFDSYANLRVIDLVVPFIGNYSPFWQGLGTVALDLILAIVVTSLLRHRIGARAWRTVHWAGYLCWPIALAHGLGAGSDAGTWWLWAISLACLALVVAAVVWRTSAGFAAVPGRTARRRPLTVSR